MGSGKVTYQNMPRITMSIQDGDFYKNETLLRAAKHSKNNNSSVHLMGLVGKGSVHSNTEHLYATLKFFQDQKVSKVFIHAFTDGRDSSPTSGVESIKDLQEYLQKCSAGKIASISGRYYAMDRNNNWDRIEKSYIAMAEGGKNKIEDPEKYLKESYKKEIFDEYIEPAFVTEGDKPVALISDNDVVVFLNYREDRARQMTQAFVYPDFSNFKTTKFENLFFATMTQYEDNLPAEVIFPPIKITNCLGKILSEHKLQQLRIAETEKFAHVTYFFNGGMEDSFSGEDRIIIPSKDVPSFDEMPEMSALEITDTVLKNIAKDKYDFMLINFANADIVGHTGNFKAAITAVEVIDNCLKKIIPVVLGKNGCLMITADHGNIEGMSNIHTGENDTEHSSNPVPFWYITPENHFAKPKENREILSAGILSDIAPTILDVLKIKKPDDMTGESMLNVLDMK
jgi:2,3-bisphosphoglycerate-independent phosphoglycerate mutase